MKPTGNNANTLLACGLCATLLLACLPPAAMAGDFELGYKSYQKGKYELAIQYFRSALMSDHDNANIRYYLADSLVKNNRLAEAQAEYQYILANAPDSQAARMSRQGLSRLRGYLIASFENGTRSSNTVSGKLGADHVVGLPHDGENYLDEITDEGRYVRWSLKKMPLKIYVERAPQGIRNFSPSFINEVYTGMDTWVATLGNQISYERVSSAEEADIRVYWVNGIDTKGNVADTGTTYTAGITFPNIYKDELRYMTVRIATFDVQGKPQDTDNIGAVAVHELGHAMGLLGHSDNEKDIMFAQNKGVIKPSKRDTNTLVLLYTNAPDITNLPPGEIEKNPEHEDEIADRVDDEIERLEAELKASGTVLNYLNVATAYLRKGKRLRDDGGKRNEYFDWFNKALQTVNGAVSVEPKNPAIYVKRCFIYQEMEKPDLALADTEEAIRLAPKDTDAYLQKAWILAGLGRTSEADSTLDQYLALDPAASASPDVKRTRDRIAQFAH